MLMSCKAMELKKKEPEMSEEKKKAWGDLRSS